MSNILKLPEITHRKQVAKSRLFSIEQIDLTGPSTNTQVTAQISPLTQISPYGAGVTN